MSFIWTRQIKRVIPEIVDIQVVTLPTYDKISDIEHKNGRFMDGTRQENNEIRRWEKENHGKEMVHPRPQNSKENI